ncbi:hypothetical protein CDAR_478461 [Caerostris darwini]|uniref:Uncharacterized protein n=1 Tax=Caerostris darwini TaxID=1538125 RepID=A0AAV4VBV3_9ARAC|nr:hypothetical protein CDAR_478461 [Caerostris darwini]
MLKFTFSFEQLLQKSQLIPFHRPDLLEAQTLSEFQFEPFFKGGLNPREADTVSLASLEDGEIFSVKFLIWKIGSGFIHHPGTRTQNPPKGIAVQTVAVFYSQIS